MANLKAGIIGYDTSHIIRFSELTKGGAKLQVEGIDIIAGYPSFSPDLPSSYERVDDYKREMAEKWGVREVSSIEELLEICDVILLESNDGRRHLKEAEPVFKAKKPVFIDKPLAASYADAKAIVKLAEENSCPMFSSSSLRFDYNILQTKADTEFGKILGCEAVSPAPLELTNPGLFWYGIHGVEILYTFMGKGCSKVFCEKTELTHLVTGVWDAGRIGTVRGMRAGACGLGATVFGEKKFAKVNASSEIPYYYQLLKHIVEFFRTGKPPVEPEETLEIMQFMEAALVSEKEERPVFLKELDEK